MSAHGGAGHSAITGELAAEVGRLQDQRDARPTWQRAADEIRAQASMRGDLDDWTVQALAQHLERVSRGTTVAATPVPVVPEQVRP